MTTRPTMDEMRGRLENIKMRMFDWENAGPVDIRSAEELQQLMADARDLVAIADELLKGQDLENSALRQLANKGLQFNCETLQDLRALHVKMDKILAALRGEGGET